MLFLDDYGKIEDQKILLIPILRDHKKHYCENEISLIYIFGLETYQEQILNLTHNDCLNREIYVLNNFLDREVYCYKKKYLGGFREKLQAYDVELLYWFNTNRKMEIKTPPEIRKYWIWYSDFDNVNDSIPIMKWLEYCRDIKDIFMVQYNKFQITEPFKKYNELLDNLEQIERNGLFTNVTQKF